MGMRNAVIVLCLVLVLSISALAEPLPSFDYVRSGAASITEADWEEAGTRLLRTLEIGEGCTVTACLSGGQTAALTIEMAADSGAETFASVLDALGVGVTAAFVADLQPNVPAGDRGYAFILLKGSNRRAVCVCAEEDYADMCWQAVHGGKKLHSSPVCSGMDAARMITPEAAAALGIENCELCRKGAANG